MHDLDRDIWKSEKSATRPEFHGYLNGPVYSAKVRYTVYHVYMYYYSIVWKVCNQTLIKETSHQIFRGLLAYMGKSGPN